MAAPVFQSVQTSGAQTYTSGTRTVTKPTGLAVGDLMIAHGVVVSTSGTTFPSGFTEISNIGTISVDPNKSAVAFKIADSADVAATDFTFTTGWASISRITGSTTIPGAVAVSQVSQLNSSSFSGAGLTPRNYGDSNLLMMFLTFSNGSSGTIGSYGIATSNPSWTEGYNDAAAPDSNGTAMAYATRAEVTATGNFSATGAGAAGADWVGNLIAIPVPFLFTSSETVTVTDGKTTTISKIISDTISLIETFLNIFNRFTNQSKNSSSYTNQTKNSTTFTNQSKNSSTWNNEDKN